MGHSQDMDCYIKAGVKMDNRRNVIDLFCGCGGLSYGFERAGYRILLGIDNDAKALETFELNHRGAKTICGDITQITYEKDIKPLTGEQKIDVIIGGPPCQGMSLSGPRRFDDPRNKLYLSYIRLVEEIQPKAFVIENVPGLVGLFGGQIKDSIIEKFTDMGYSIRYRILCAADYGVPQNRKRVVFVGLKDGVFEYPQKEKDTVTCSMALADLPPLENELGTEPAEYICEPQNPYQKLMRSRSKKVQNHVAAAHSEKVRSIISLVPDGGNYKDLPEEYKSTRNFHVAWTRFASSRPAPTIDTGHRHHFHYKYNRVPTVRECARLQSFPDDFIFLGNKTQQFRQVGNAVPPLMAQKIAEQLQKSLQQNPENIREKSMEKSREENPGDKMTEYSIPEEYYFRIHHVRPRFKGDIENVLIYMAEEISAVGELETEEFVSKVNRAIYRYPGNAHRELKTINNWRTEISALFGFIEHTKTTDRPGRRAVELAESQDLVATFKVFLYNFQYPGAHIKPRGVLEQIKAGIHFKPARYILQVLRCANADALAPVGLTKAEVCHCIFNDLRVTRDHEGAENTWKRIKDNRAGNLQYDWAGDVIRYAGDIVDYMETANLLKTYDGRMYYLNTLEEDAVIKFCESSEWFSGYDAMIERRSGSIDAVKNCINGWFAYVNRHMEDTDFSTDILSYIADDEEELKRLKEHAEQGEEVFEQESAIREDLIGQRIAEDMGQFTTKDIGDIGESLVHGHECMRMKIGGREDLVHLIKRIPTQFAVGYDIGSVELDGRKRYIEVKTTISSKPLHFNRIHLTKNEWSTAESLKDRYYVYRLLLSKSERKLLLLQDPVGLYKRDEINMVPSDGADVVFDPQKVGEFEELLTWKN